MRTYITKKPATIATLPVGYSDGYPRLLSNKSEVLIKGRRFKVVGRDCMDQAMVDLGNFKGVKIGETAILVGRQNKQEITLVELAKKARTISYELACSIGKNCPTRIFK